MTMSARLRQLLRLCAIVLIVAQSACGFHLRGDASLAAPLHNLYVQSTDPYGTLAKELEVSLKMSRVVLATTPSQATTLLVIHQDSTSQDLLSVGGTQQTRQYRLSVTVVFEVMDATGRSILAPETLTESRIITIQSNQILGSSNEANLYFQQMRRSLASSIIYRLSSTQVTHLINQAFQLNTSKANMKHVNNKHHK